MGQAEQRIIKECYAKHSRLPDHIQNAPVLHAGSGFFFEAFMALGTCRSIGMATGPIPWTAVEAYADSLGLSFEEREDLHYHVHRMDQAYLQHLSDKMLANKPK